MKTGNKPIPGLGSEWDLETRAKYERYIARRFVVVYSIAFWASIIAIPIFWFWDVMVSGRLIVASLAIRLVGSTLLFLAWLWARHKDPEKQYFFMLPAVLIIVQTSVSLSLAQFQNGFIWGVPGLCLVFLVFFLVTRTSHIVMTTFVTVLVPNLVMLLNQEPSRVIISANFFFAAFGGITFMLNLRIVQSFHESFLLGLRLEELAHTDPLSGLSNRRHFMDLAVDEYERSRRYLRPISVFILDVDHFKKINDTYGHYIGDEALRQAARKMTDVLRGVDVVGRFGGDEFVALLPETDKIGASIAAERIRVAVGTIRIPVGEEVVKFTVSLGVTSLTPSDSDVDQLFKRADEALLRAKESGRNTFMVV